MRQELFGGQAGGMMFSLAEEILPFQKIARGVTGWREFGEDGNIGPGFGCALGEGENAPGIAIEIGRRCCWSARGQFSCTNTIVRCRSTTGFREARSVFLGRGSKEVLAGTGDGRMAALLLLFELVVGERGRGFVEFDDGIGAELLVAPEFDFVFEEIFDGTRGHDHLRRHKKFAVAGPKLITLHIMTRSHFSPASTRSL
jgi:hypothetical protein